jgi:23S rRNA pseudouridine2605 synthase
MKERLQKYISNNGIASRRKSEELIFEGRVRVNGKLVKEIVMIDDETDVVEVDGVVIKPFQ